MGRYTFMVLASPKDGHEADWNAWHEERHVKDVLAIDGVLNAQRLRSAAVQQEGSGNKWKFATIYEIEADDPQTVFDAIAERIGTDRMPMTSHSDPSKTVSQLWETISVHQSA